VFLHGNFILRFSSEHLTLSRKLPGACHVQCYANDWVTPPLTHPFLGSIHMQAI